MSRRDQLFARLLRWQSDGRIAGAIMVATCNRLELVLDVPAEADATAKKIVAAEVFDDLPHHDHCDADAAYYLLRLAAGLDSLVRGEDQILGQLREAFKQAEKHGMLSPKLRVLRNQLVAAARDVRHRTGISKTKVSVASLAARQLENAGRNLVVVGAGETGRLAIETLIKRGNSRILVVNRTFAKAKALADHFGIEAMSLSDFLAQTESATDSPWDGMLIAVHSKQPLFRPCHVRSMRMAIDISMPCVIDPEARMMADVEIMDMDGVASLVQFEGDRRTSVLATAEDLVKGKAGTLHRAIEGTGHGNHLARIVDQHIETAMQELQTTLDTKLRHLSAADQEQVRQTILRATRRNAHHHIKDVRELAET